MNPKNYGKILVLAVCFSLASCYKILIGTSFASPSHLIPLATLAEELIARGHQITFVLPKEFSVIPQEAKKLILAKAANPTAVFGSKADLTLWQMMSMFASSSSDNCEYVSSDKQLKKHLNSATYDLAIVSTINQECLLVTIRQYQKNIPFIMYHPGFPMSSMIAKVTGISVWDAAYNPGAPQDSTEIMKFEERFVNFFIRLLMSALFNAIGIPNNRILTRNLGPEHEDANNIQSNASFLFISSNFEFDYPVPNDTRHYHDWLSSMPTTQASSKSHPNTKVIISHGGFMTLQETIYHGVPYLGLPIHGSKSDRKRNIRLAEYRGIGRKLDFDNLTKEDITEKLHDLVNNKRYRENAKRISGYMKDQMFTPKERAVFYTEYAIRHHGAEHFKSYARNLTFVQIHSIDVISFILICAFLLLGIFYLIVKFTFKTSRCIFRFFFKSKKTKVH
ncbi:UDP-glucuronosyltransferase 2B20 [Nymphon striatum]|nr:UDP-glucuronosyltransferase 2B20 [Nymphon striatum]